MRARVAGLFANETAPRKFQLELADSDRLLHLCEPLLSYSASLDPLCFAIKLRFGNLTLNF